MFADTVVAAEVVRRTTLKGIVEYREAWPCQERQTHEAKLAAAHVKWAFFITWCGVRSTFSDCVTVAYAPGTAEFIA